MRGLPDKIIEPKFEKVNIGRTVLFGDTAYSRKNRSLMEEFFNNVAKNLFFYNIHFNSVEVFDNVDAFDKNYDVLFFDYGGIDGCGDLLRDYSRQLFKTAIDKPNKDFVAIGCYTDIIFKELTEELKVQREEKPANVFFSLSNYIDSKFKKFDESKSEDPA
jgi:hypothetical protein